MKKRNYLKGLRVLLAILFFVPILLFFVDFSGVLPDSVHRLLHLQLMPALLGGMVGLIVFQFAGTGIRTYLLFHDMSGRRIPGYHQPSILHR